MNRFVLLMFTATAFASDKAPLPAPIGTAKKILLVNHTNWLKGFDALYSRVKKIPAWSITEDRKEAELVLILEVGDAENRGTYTAPIGTAVASVPIVTRPCILLFVDPKRDVSRNIVFRSSRSCGSADSTIKDLLKEVEQRLPKPPK